MRPVTSCTTCRSRKRKCEVESQGTACTRCLKTNDYCSLAPSDLQSLLSLTDGFCTFHTVDPLANQGLCNELVDLYFDMMHDTQHSLFHRPTFIESQREGCAPPMLVAAMMALAARFSSNTSFKDIDPWDRGRYWAEYSRHLFNHRKTAISLTTVQMCSLLSILSFTDGDMATETLYGALAIRMVQSLELPRQLSSDLIRRETEIRVWWTIWCMDSWTSLGARLPKQLVADPACPRPLNEITFESLEPDAYFDGSRESPKGPLRPREDGLWAQMIPLTEIMTQIKELQETIVRDGFSRIQSLHYVHLIANKLDSWEFRLPPRLRNTVDNLHWFAERGHGRTFVALHIGYHHHAQNLYYQFLHHDNENSDEQMMIYMYANRCKDHAAALSNLLYLANSTPECQCLWVIIGHLLVISSSVHLHTLLFDDEDMAIDNAKTMLKQNFELVVQLRRYWPSLDISMSRLRAFHRACQYRMHTTFAMDQWMLHFLQHYMKPAGNRDVMSSLFMGSANANAAGASVGDDNWNSPDFGSEQDLSWDPQAWQSAGQEATGSDILQVFL